MPPASKSVPEIGKELWELLVTYARQETVGPLKTLGYRLKWGFPGALCIALGYFLLTMAIIRVIDVHLSWGTNWFGYLPAAAFLGVVMVVMGLKLRADKVPPQGTGARSKPNP